ncbi:unnamed protein product [Lampetra fluviatilis]
MGVEFVCSASVQHGCPRSLCTRETHSTHGSLALALALARFFLLFFLDGGRNADTELALPPSSSLPPPPCLRHAFFSFSFFIFIFAFNFNLCFISSFFFLFLSFCHSTASAGK